MTSFWNPSNVNFCSDISETVADIKISSIFVQISVKTTFVDAILKIATTSQCGVEFPNISMKNVFFFFWLIGYGKLRDYNKNSWTQRINSNSVLAISKLEIPQLVTEGEDLKIDCTIDTRGGDVKWVKWLKDDQEILILEKGKPPVTRDVEGVVLDVRIPNIHLNLNCLHTNCFC